MKTTTKTAENRGNKFSKRIFEIPQTNIFYLRIITRNESVSVCVQRTALQNIVNRSLRYRGRLKFCINIYEKKKNIEMEKHR